MKVEWQLENAAGIFVVGGIYWTFYLLFMLRLDIYLKIALALFIALVHFLIASGIYYKKIWAVKAATKLNKVMLLLGLLTIFLMPLVKALQGIPLHLVLDFMDIIAISIMSSYIIFYWLPLYILNRPAVKEAFK
jgi:hypothetical protein